MYIDSGTFVVSLDFELYWGVRENRSIFQYKENLDGARRAVKKILEVFDEYHIHATWAIVGFIFYQDVESLKRDIPLNVPHYEDSKLSSYDYIRHSEKLDIAYHFAPELIEFICAKDAQEIATHTFSHYYCLEDGSGLDSFLTDIDLALRVGRKKGLVMRSIVFPRNQFAQGFLPSLAEKGITSFRGNQKAWFYQPVKRENEGVIFRIVRRLDDYINVSGHNTYTLKDISQEKPYNISASKFLWPVSKKLAVFDMLRLRRIKNAMTYAAENNAVFHIWWHPHNFGANTRQNLIFLRKILDHYRVLEKTYGMRSCNMGEISEQIEKNISESWA